MKLQSLDATARGQSRRITFDRPVAIISGPNGAGKSTALSALELALKGTVTVDGKPRKKEGDIFAHLSANGEPVGVYAAFDGCSIGRNLTKTETGAKQGLQFSGAIGAKIDVAQGAIIATIGDLARVDVADLLSKGPTDRRAAVLGLCRQFARPWTLAELREAFTKAGGPEAFDFKPDPAIGLLASLERDAAAAKQAVLDANARVKTLQQAIDRMAEHAADNAEPGDAEAMGARLRDLNAEIERLSAEVAAIDAANQSDATIARRLDELAQLPPVERAQEDLRRAREAYSLVLMDKAGLVPPTPPVEPAEIADLRRQVAEQEAILSRARFDEEQARKRADALKHIIAHADGADCPTCRRPMDESAVEALGVAMAAEDEAARAAVFRAENAGPVVDCLRADLDDAVNAHQKAIAAFHEANKAHAAKAAGIDAAVSEKKRAVADAEELLHRSTMGDDERAILRGRRAKLATGDADMLRKQIEGATQERAELTKRRDAVVADAARQRAYKDQIANRDEVKDSVPGIKAAAEAWREVVNQVAESAIEPFMEACNAALPTGWAMAFDVDGGDFTVTRPVAVVEMRERDGVYEPAGPLTVPFSAMGGREKIEVTAAMAIALAKCAGNPWKAVILDDCDRIAGDWWDDPEYPQGLFAAFVQRLASAANAGLVDQVIMATSRRLDGAEGDAIRAVAQVVEIGVTPKADPDDSLPWSAPEVEGQAEDNARDKTIRNALKGAGAAAFAFMYEHLHGVAPRSTTATVKRVVTERMLEDSEPLDAVLGLIEKAKADHPARARGVGGEEAVAS